MRAAPRQAPAGVASMTGVLVLLAAAMGSSSRRGVATAFVSSSSVLGTTARRAWVNHAAASSSSRWHPTAAPPPPPPVSSSSQRRRLPTPHAGSVALLATSSRGSSGSKASSSSGRRKKAPAPAPAKAKAPPPTKQRQDEEEDEDEDEEDMTEEDLIALMKSPEGVDAVWANMLKSMKATQGMDLDLEEEEGDWEDDDEEEEEEGEGGEVVVRLQGDWDADEKEEEEQEEDEADGHDGGSSGSSGPGTIHIRNSQRSVAVDMRRLQAQVAAILEIVGRRDHDVSLWLTNDRSIREYNDRYRGIRHATDILSFPFHEYEAPERPTKESLNLNGQVKDLGDMMVSVAYVARQCARDMEDLAAGGENKWWEERGASGAMSRIFDVEGRLPYLVVHGVLHLLGHDHETDGDYQRMVAEEERVIAEFLKRFPEAAPPAPAEAAATAAAAAAAGSGGKKAGGAKKE